MPKRTNTFQEVVSIIYEHLAGDASKEESAMLPNRLTGELREVDVILRSTTAGHQTVIAIEAAATSRRASVDWVEQMIRKHKNLPTDKVILVAEAGFSKQARTLAVAEQMVPVTSENLDADDPVCEIVDAVPSLWPKVVSLSPESARVWVETPGEGIRWFKPPADLDVVLEDGRCLDLGTRFFQLYHGNFLRLVEQIRLASISEDLDRFFIVRVGPGWTVKVDGEPRSFYVRHVDGQTTEVHRIDALEFRGKAKIQVSEIPLTHRRLGEIDVRYAFGEGSIGGKPALVVATEDEQGGKLSIQLRDEAQ